MFAGRLHEGLGLAVAAACALAAWSDASAEDRIRWKMHSAFASKLAVLGTAGKRMEQTISEVSDGAFELKFFEPGALVPASQVVAGTRAGPV